VTTLAWLLAQVLWVAWYLASWLAIKLFWLVLWLLLPLLVAAFVLLRLAEHLVGREPVRSWVKRHSLRFGRAGWHRTRRALFALGALPLRVLAFLVLYTLWHSIISLWWTPRWSPWQRAWARRWRRRAGVGPSRP
jgi:hypothetical protein